MPIIQVKVKPGARVSRLTMVSDGMFHAELRSRPVEGKANTELIALVAKHFGCSRAAVTLKVGSASRLKLVHIADE